MDYCVDYCSVLPSTFSYCSFIVVTVDSLNHFVLLNKYCKLVLMCYSIRIFQSKYPLFPLFVCGPSHCLINSQALCLCYFMLNYWIRAQHGDLSLENYAATSQMWVSAALLDLFSWHQRRRGGDLCDVKELELKYSIWKQFFC